MLDREASNPPKRRGFALEGSGVVNIYPILIDSRPSYLSGRGRTASLLLVPFGTGTLIGHLISRLPVVTQRLPLVLCPPGVDSDYQQTLQNACPSVQVAHAWEECSDTFAAYEPSDALLIIDPRCFPIEGSEMEPLLRYYSSDPRWAIHLVAFEKGVAGTKEYVDFDASGRIRRIQRYYDSVTWPFISGVAASVLPVSCNVIGNGLAATSLWDLRHHLTVCGVPSHDLAIKEEVHNLNEERGLLAASEQFILSAAGTRRESVPAPLYVGDGHRIHPTARIMGPVILHRDVVVERDAKVIGPAIIGADARIEAGALVTHTTVAPGSIVPAGGIVQYRAVFEGLPAEPSGSSSGLCREVITRLVCDNQEGGVENSGRVHYASVKRLLDALGATAVLIILSPMLLVIAVLIWLDSRGSILYGPKREGRGSHAFRCWKFRTMYEGAETRQRELYALNPTCGPQFKLDADPRGDPRVTRIGRLLRSINLDELPQLINVILGEMSLVGPRPSPFRENQLCIPWREARLSVRPGMTGLWQVCRHDRAMGDFHQWIEYDLLYVQHKSFWLDLKILMATVFTLAGRGHVPLSWILRPHRLAEAVGAKDSRMSA